MVDFCCFYLFLLICDISLVYCSNDDITYIAFHCVLEVTNQSIGNIGIIICDKNNDKYVILVTDIISCIKLKVQRHFELLAAEHIIL